MRKLLFIVLAFTACLLFPEGGDGACIRQQAPSAAFSAGDMHTASGSASVRTIRT